MAAKMIAFDQEARQAMQRGVAKLARADYAARLLAGPKERRKGPPHERHEPGRDPG